MKPLPASRLIAAAMLAGMAHPAWGAEPEQSQVISVQPSKQRNLVPDPEMRVFERAPPRAVPQPGAAPERVRAPPRRRIVPAPDEAPLWELLREQRHAELDTEISRLRKAFPHWSPPVRLLELKDQAETRSHIARAIERAQWNEVAAQAQRHPGEFSCAQVAFLWGLAEAQQALGNPAQALAVYQRIVPACPHAPDRIATLQKARLILARQDFEALLQREAQAGGRNAAEQAEVDQISYEHRLRGFLQAVEAKDQARAIGMIGAFEPLLRARQDARNAALVGWVWFEAGQHGTAAEWFARALEWEPALADARYGLALSNLKLDRVDAAEEALRQADGGDARVRALRTEVAMLRAWDTYQRGDDREAARLFTEAYRDTPDEDSAQGVVLSLSRDGRWDELSALARSQGGLLEERWRTAVAQRHYGRKLFLAAQDAAPGALPQLHNIFATTLAIGAALRDKSGEEGKSKLRLLRAPLVEGVKVFDGTHELRLQVSRVMLDSGSLPQNATIGSFPVAGGYVVAPTTRLSGSYETLLSWQRQGWTTPYASVGLTPGGAVLPSALVGSLGVKQQHERGDWRAEIYSQAVRESILSYTGIVDPYTGQAWGRVRRSGVMVAGYAALTERWGASGKLQLMDLQGRDVAGNQGLSMNASLARDLRLRGFDYFTVGPDISYEAYRRNLSHFTLGHGGYFSPERLLSVGVSSHFLTLEARQHIIKGDFSVGLFNKREAASACFPAGSPLPVNPACGYAATRASGVYWSAELMGVRRLTNHLQAGGAVVLRRSAQYDDKALMAFVRIVFDSRPVVMSSDLPERMLQSLY